MVDGDIAMSNYDTLPMALCLTPRSVNVLLRRCHIKMMPVNTSWTDFCLLPHVLSASQLATQLVTQLVNQQQLLSLCVFYSNNP